MRFELKPRQRNSRNIKSNIHQQSSRMQHFRFARLPLLVRCTHSNIIIIVESTFCHISPAPFRCLCVLFQRFDKPKKTTQDEILRIETYSSVLSLESMSIWGMYFVFARVCVFNFFPFFPCQRPSLSQSSKITNGAMRIVCTQHTHDDDENRVATRRQFERCGCQCRGWKTHHR